MLEHMSSFFALNEKKKVLCFEVTVEFCSHLTSVLVKCELQLGC